MKRSLILITILLFISTMVYGAAPAKTSSPPPTIRINTAPATNSVVKGLQIQMVKQQTPPPPPAPPAPIPKTPAPKTYSPEVSQQIKPIPAPIPYEQKVIPPPPTKVIEKTVIVNQSSSMTDAVILHHLLETSNNQRAAMQPAPVQVMPTQDVSQVIVDRNDKTTQGTFKVFVICMFIGGFVFVFIYRKQIVSIIRSTIDNNDKKEPITTTQGFKEVFVNIPRATISTMYVAAMKDLEEEHTITEKLRCGESSFYFLKNIASQHLCLFITSKDYTDRDMVEGIYLQLMGESRFLNSQVVAGSTITPDTEFLSVFTSEASMLWHCNGEETFRGIFKNISPTEDKTIGVRLEDSEKFFGLYGQEGAPNIVMIRIIDRNSCLLYTYLGYVVEDANVY